MNTTLNDMLLCITVLHIQVELQSKVLLENCQNRWPIFFGCVLIEKIITCCFGDNGKYKTIFTVITRTQGKPPKKETFSCETAKSGSSCMYCRQELSEKFSNGDTHTPFKTRDSNLPLCTQNVEKMFCLTFHFVIILLIHWVIYEYYLQKTQTLFLFVCSLKSTPISEAGAQN